MIIKVKPKWWGGRGYGGGGGGVSAKGVVRVREVGQRSYLEIYIEFVQFGLFMACFLCRLVSHIQSLIS